MAYRKTSRKYIKRRRASRRLTARAVRKIAQKVVNKKIEVKEKIYQSTSIGIGPVSGSAVSFASTSYDTGASVAQLCRGITNGTGEGERIGHKIKLIGVYIKATLSCASTTEPNNYRLLLVRPKGTYSTTSLSSFMLQLTSNVTSGVTQYVQSIDTDIWQVIWDKTIFMKPFATFDANYLQNYNIRKFIKFRNGLNMQWSEANSQPMRDLFLVAVSDSVISSNPGWLAGQVKLYYTDA